MIIEAAQKLFDKSEINQEEFELLKTAGSLIKEEDLDKMLEEMSKEAAVTKIWKSMPTKFWKDIKGSDLKSKLFMLGIGSAVGAGTAIAKSDPVKRGLIHILRKALPKATSKVILPQPSFAARHFNKVKPAAFAVAATAGAGVAGKELYDIGVQRAKIKSSFENLQAKTPMLQQYPKKQIKEYFDVVKTFSPRSASNPLVAGALVHKMLEFGGVDHKLVQDIATIESRKPESILTEIARTGIKESIGLPRETIDKT